MQKFATENGIVRAFKQVLIDSQRKLILELTLPKDSKLPDPKR